METDSGLSTGRGDFRQLDSSLAYSGAHGGSQKPRPQIARLETGISPASPVRALDSNQMAGANPGDGR